MKLSGFPEMSTAPTIDVSRSISSNMTRISSARPRLSVLTGAPGTSSEITATPASRESVREGILTPSRSLNHHRVAHTARGAYGHQPKLAVTPAELVDQRR